MGFYTGLHFANVRIRSDRRLGDHPWSEFFELAGRVLRWRGPAGKWYRSEELAEWLAGLCEPGGRVLQCTQEGAGGAWGWEFDGTGRIRSLALVEVEEFPPLPTERSLVSAHRDERIERPPLEQVFAQMDALLADGDDFVHLHDDAAEDSFLALWRTPNRRYRVWCRAPGREAEAGNLGLERARAIVGSFFEQKPDLWTLARWREVRHECTHASPLLYLASNGFPLRPELAEEFRDYRDRHRGDGQLELRQFLADLVDEGEEDPLWVDYQGDSVLRSCHDQYLARWLARHCENGMLVLVDEEVGDVWAWSLNEDASVTLLELRVESRWKRVAPARR